MKSTFVPFSSKMEKMAISYLKYCKSNLVFSDTKIKKVENPKISIIITIYNDIENIILSLRSIQNQSLKEIEIIIINDCSKDDTEEILKKYKKEDPRISIIKTEKNRGILYCRIYGALQSKGEYICFMNSYDAFCQINLLMNLYKIAEEKNKPDIINYIVCGSNFDGKDNFNNFLLYYIYNPNIFGEVFKQPEISDNYLQKNKNLTQSTFIYDKLYSNKLIKDICEYIDESIWNQHIVFCSDLLICYAAMKKATSFVIIDEIGYWHRFNNKLAMKTETFEIDGNNLLNSEIANKKILDYIIIKEEIFKLTEEDENSEELREYILRDLENNNYFDGVVRSHHILRLMNLYQKFIKWKYITNNTKIRIKEGIKKLMEGSIPPKDKFKIYIDKL